MSYTYIKMNITWIDIFVIQSIIVNFPHIIIIIRQFWFNVTISQLLLVILLRLT